MGTMIVAAVIAVSAAAGITVVFIGRTRLARASGAVLAAFCIVLLIMMATPVEAKDWSWFGKNRPRTGKCWFGAREVAASVYECTGHRTASGEPCRDGFFAASNMPDGWLMHSDIIITNPSNGRTVVVRRNDTLPKKSAWRVGARLDLMPKAFRALGPLGPGGRRESGWVCAR